MHTKKRVHANKKPQVGDILTAKGAIEQVQSIRTSKSEGTPDGHMWASYRRCPTGALFQEREKLHSFTTRIANK